MSVFNKFNAFTKDLLDAKHNFGSHTFKVMLTNTLPVAASAVKTDITEIGAGNGYSTGGGATTITESTASGVGKIVGTSVVITAAGGTIGPFRYAVLYNATAGTQPLIGWVDYGAALTLNDTETFTVAFDGTNGIFTVT